MYHWISPSSDVLGSCSLCGGDVVQPKWGYPVLEPHCVKCGARPKRHIIEMEPVSAPPVKPLRVRRGPHTNVQS